MNGPKHEEAVVGFKEWLRAEWDRVTGFVLVAAGAVVLWVGYHGMSGSPYVAEQLAYVVSGGLGGIFLLGLGGLFLIRSDLVDHWRQLDRIEAAIRGERDPASLAVPANGSRNGQVGMTGEARGEPGDGGGAADVEEPSNDDRAAGLAALVHPAGSDVSGGEQAGELAARGGNDDTVVDAAPTINTTAQQPSIPGVEAMAARADRAGDRTSGGKGREARSTKASRQRPLGRSSSRRRGPATD